MSKNLFIAALALVIVFAAFAFYTNTPLSVVDRPITSIQQEIYETTLENGLHITVKEMHSQPLLTIQFWVKTGAKNEPEDFKGIAHIFEHMWFKGTEAQPVGTFDKKVESLGGELNAMTYLDWTMYYIVVPSDKFDDIFPNMADLLLNPLFDAKELEKDIPALHAFLNQ